MINKDYDIIVSPSCFSNHDQPIKRKYFLKRDVKDYHLFIALVKIDTIGYISGTRYL